MRVVVGCPIAEREWILQRWIDSIRSQVLPDVELEIVCLYTRSHDRTEQVLRDNSVRVVESPLPTRSYERLYDHLWSYQDHEYEYMASLRNELRSFVMLTYGPDYFFSLDSDILMPNEHALAHLLACAVNNQANGVAPLVDMGNHPGIPPAWNFMYLRDNGTGGDRPPGGVDIDHDAPLNVGVIMAAMLLDKHAQMVPWRNHPQGEDIGWSMGASYAGLKLLVDTAVTCDHRMRVR